jgi:hypothetical protein
MASQGGYARHARLIRMPEGWLSIKVRRIFVHLLDFSDDDLLAKVGDSFSYIYNRFGSKLVCKEISWILMVFVILQVIGSSR